MANSSVLKKLKSSIFLKLLIVLLTATLLIILIVKNLTDPTTKERLIKNRNRVLFTHMLVDKIGYPPNQQVVEELSNEIGIKVRIEEHEKTLYSTDNSIKPIASYRPIAFSSPYDANFQVGSLNNMVFTILETNQAQYLFLFKVDFFLNIRDGWVPLLGAAILIILIFSYFVIRHILKPLEKLNVGIQQFGSGHLNYQVPVENTNDELGELVNSFNEMTKRIDDVVSSKEQLLLDVSHELRSPITRIKVALALDTEKSRSHIIKNINDLETMINELLESARLDTPQGSLRIQEANICDLIHHIVPNFKDEKPGIIFHDPGKEILLLVDPQKIEMVIKNLCENALKYSAEQSRPVEVHVHEQSDKKVLVVVKDYGNGIPKEEMELIFEPFYRTDKSRIRPSAGGYGLGLSLSKKIMDAHKGEILVSSSTMEGTTFTLIFHPHTSNEN